MRVLLVTSDEPLYLPSYLAPILRERADDVVAVVVAPFPEGEASAARRQLRALGFRAVARLGVKYARGRLLGALPLDLGHTITGRPHSVRRVARRSSVPVVAAPDVNDPEVLETAEELDPEVLLSVVAGQWIGPDLRRIPDVAINLHGSLLPKYRGRATAFWPLYYGDDESGVTAHLLTDEWDAGPIVDQRSFRLDPGDTVHDVYGRIAEVGSTLALDVLRAVEAGSFETRPNPTTEGDYHSLPTAAERRAFHRRGNRFA